MTTKHRIFTTSVASVYPYYVAKAEKELRTVFVVYANSASFQTKAGETVDYYPSIRSELVAMIQGLGVSGTGAARR